MKKHFTLILTDYEITPPDMINPYGDLSYICRVQADFTGTSLVEAYNNLQLYLIKAGKSDMSDLYNKPCPAAQSITDFKFRVENTDKEVHAQIIRW